MKKSWDVNVNGTVYKIEYKAGFGAKIIVNGEKHKAKSQNWWINLIDYPIRIDDTEIHVVAMGTKVDLAVNGVYLGSGQTYTPLNKVPAISNVFVGISCVAGFVLEGLIGLMVGVLFSTFYVKKGLEGNKKAVIGAFIGCTVLQIVLFIFISVFYVRAGLV